MTLTRKKYLLPLITSIALCCVSNAQTTADPEAKSEAKPDIKETSPAVKSAKSAAVYGWKEWVWVAKPELIVRAKLDTGARTSSVHATNIEEIELDGKKWVKFTISNPNDKKSPRLRLKAPLLRVAKIKNDTGGLDERFVVPLKFQIGKRKLVGEFNLNDRSKMTCALLIGRNLLKELGHVDSSKTDLLEKPKRPKTKKSKPARVIK